MTHPPRTYVLGHDLPIFLKLEILLTPPPLSLIGSPTIRNTRAIFSVEIGLKEKWELSKCTERHKNQEKMQDFFAIFTQLAKA